jgi:glutamyl-tRNA reductase
VDSRSAGGRRTSGYLVVVGLSHRTTPLEFRERMTIRSQQWQAVAPAPSVLLSTCNRVEVYTWTESRPNYLAHRLARALARAGGIAYADLAPHLFTYTGMPALVHLVRVAAGLDSLVLGDDQIRGQVHDACEQARGLSTLPTPIDSIFRRALQAGRRIRARGPLGRHPSVAQAALFGARRLLGPDSLDDKSVLVLGAGGMAKAAAQTLLAGNAQVILLNRTVEHAARLAQSLGPGVRSDTLDALPRLLPRAAMLVGATASRQPLITASMLTDALVGRTETRLVIVDIAVPRDVEPSVRNLAGVQLLDLDDLEQMCPMDSELRRTEVSAAEQSALDEAAHIDRWLRMRAFVPAVVELRERGEEIRTLELRRAQGRLRDLTPEQRAAVDAVTGAIVNKLLHGPTVLLREGRSRAPVDELLHLHTTSRGRRYR